MTELPSQGIVIPGQGLVPLHVLQAQRAVAEYDEDLTVGRHEQTGDWVIMLKRGPEGRPFPVYGLGSELPAPERLKQRLYEGDVRRNSTKILKQLERRYETERTSARAEREAATEVASEAFLWAARKDGHAHIPQVFIPGDKAGV